MDSQNAAGVKIFSNWTHADFLLTTSSIQKISQSMKNNFFRQKCFFCDFDLSKRKWPIRTD